MIETERLYIRPITLDDAPFIQKLLQSPDYIKNIGKRTSNTLEETASYIRSRILDHYEQYGYGNNVFIRKSDGEKLGTVSVYNRKEFEGVDLGYAILPEFYKKGYTYEAAQGLIKYARDILNFEYLTAYTSYSNVGSIALIKKLGFIFDREVYWEEWSESSPRYMKVLRNEPSD